MATDRAMETLRDIARNITAGARDITIAELVALPLPEALSYAWFGLQKARRALEAQLDLAMREGDTRRIGIAKEYLAGLAESEGRLEKLIGGLADHEC
jgi:hypothetical protein